ncbi:MAG: hypothetical protein CL609_12710 [Anaerolineaceae bacterium]|nr:hypothetical protein [Anaerolineaceae bacterium]
MDKKQNSTKKELILQIYFPLIGFVFLVLAIGLLAILSTTNDFSQTADWANVSVVVLSVPFLIFTFIILAVIVLLIYGQAKLIRWLPIQLKRLYALVLTISAAVWRFSDKAAQPIIKVNGWKAALNRLFK